MRTIALSTTVCGLVFAISGISEANDFDALLQDLSFGASPSVAIEQPSTADLAIETPAETTNPASQGFIMPTANTLATPVGMPLMALDEPATTSEIQPNANVDFVEMFTAQDVSDTDAALAPIPEPLVNPEPQMIPAPAMVAGGDCGCAVHNSCEQVIICRPHLTPNLPSSTFLQYFRSNKCYTNVWDGYQQNCGSNHDHLHGTCDCFNPHKKSCLGGNHSNCGRCDGCDR